MFADLGVWYIVAALVFIHGPESSTVWGYEGPTVIPLSSLRKQHMPVLKNFFNIKDYMPNKLS